MNGLRFSHIFGRCLISLLLVQITTFAQESNTMERNTAKLIKGYEDNSFKAIFNVSYVHQEKVKELKAANPGVMWQKVVEDYYKASEKAFETPTQPSGSLFGALNSLGEASFNSPQDPSSSVVRPLLIARPKWKILETRKTQWRNQWSGGVFSGGIVYVRLNFDTPDSSPLFGEGVLKDIILAFAVESEGGLVYAAQAVPKSQTLWEHAPLHIIGAQWNTALGEGFGSFNTLVGYNILGGTPPYRSDTYCGNISLERNAQSVLTPNNASLYGSPQENPTDHIVVRFAEPRDQGFPLRCSVRVTDSSGAQDKASFEVPQLQTTLWAPFCWIRNPWYGWREGIPNARQGCAKLSELETGESTIPGAPSGLAGGQGGAPDRNLTPQAYFGTWKKVNPGNIVTVIISGTPAQSTVHAWAACRPQDCDFGEHEASWRGDALVSVFEQQSQSTTGELIRYVNTFRLTLDGSNGLRLSRRIHNLSTNEEYGGVTMFYSRAP